MMKQVTMLVLINSYSLSGFILLANDEGNNNSLIDLILTA